MHTLKLIRCWSTFWFAYTTQSFWVYESISMAHLDFAIFYHSSLQKCSKSVRLRGHLLCTALSRSPERFSIGFRSGLWLGHCHLLLKPFFCWFGCMLWVVFVLRDDVPLHLPLSSRSLKVLCSIDWYLKLFIIPSTLTKSPVPAEEKHA